MASLIEALKQVSTEAVAAGNPTSVVYGKVISDDPLKIQIDNKIILDEAFLVLTRNVQDFEVDFDIDFKDEKEIGTIIIDNGEHYLNRIKYKKGKAKIRNAMKKGDLAIMVQQQGGQKYIVVDKMNTDAKEGE